MVALQMLSPFTHESCVVCGWLIVVQNGLSLSPADNNEENKDTYVYLKNHDIIAVYLNGTLIARLNSNQAALTASSKLIDMV